MSAISIFSRVAHLSFARLINSLATVALLVLATRFLSIEDYAIFRQAFLPVEMLLPVITLGVPSAIQYLLSGSRYPTRLLADAMVISLVPVVVLTSAVLLFIALRPNSWNSPDFMFLALIASAGAFAIFQSANQTLIPVLVYRRMTRTLAIAMIATSSISVPLGYFFLSAYPGPFIAGVSKLIFALMTTTLLIALARHLFIQTDPVSHDGILERYRLILASSVPLGASTAVSTLSLNVDKGIVALLALPAEFSVYVNGAIEVPLIGVLTGSIATVLVGEMALAYRNGNRESAHSLFQLAARKTALLMFPATVILWILAPVIVVAVFGERYADSAIPFRIYLLMLPLRIVVFGSALTAMGKGRILLIRSAAELLFNLVASVTLFYTFGIAGVAIGTVLVSYFWSAPFSMYHISRGFSVGLLEVLPYKELAKIAGISLLLSPVAFAVLSAFDEMTLAAPLALVLYLSAVAATLYASGLTPSIRR